MNFCFVVGDDFYAVACVFYVAFEVATLGFAENEWAEADSLDGSGYLEFVHKFCYNRNRATRNRKKFIKKI